MDKYYKRFRGDSGIGISGMGTPFYEDERGNEVDEARANTNLVGTENLYEFQQRQRNERIAREAIERRRFRNHLRGAGRS